MRNRNFGLRAYGRLPRYILETALDAAGGQVVFGPYTLIKVLGRCEMGTVWLARDEELERYAALKFLPDRMIRDRASLDQLKDEAKRCLELTHPHIVPIHDFVHDERTGCTIMLTIARRLSIVTWKSGNPNTIT